jgi:hypothetical protein
MNKLAYTFSTGLVIWGPEIKLYAQNFEIQGTESISYANSDSFEFEFLLNLEKNLTENRQ